MIVNKNKLEYYCPKFPVDVIIDTDTYNEIDDQFAIAYALANSDKINLQGLTCAPFKKTGWVSDIYEGLEKSRKEIETILKLCNRREYLNKIYIGSERFLDNETDLVISEAVELIVETAARYSKAHPLYICVIGAITNIASAILKDPLIVDKIVVVWLGGNSLRHWNNKEYNLRQDVAAVRVVINSGCPFVQLPAEGVVSEFLTTGNELEYWLKNKNPLCNYLFNKCLDFAERRNKTGAWSKVIWDVTSVAWLLNIDERFMLAKLNNRYIPSYEDCKYEKSISKSKMMYVYHINRDALMTDLFQKLLLF